MIETHSFRDGALSDFMEIQSHCNAKRQKYSQCKVSVCSSVSRVCPVCMWTVACVCACVGPVLYIVDRSSCETLKNLMAWGRNNFLSVCDRLLSLQLLLCLHMVLYGETRILPPLHQSLWNHLTQLRVTFAYGCKVWNGWWDKNGVLCFRGAVESVS